MYNLNPYSSYGTSSMANPYSMYGGGMSSMYSPNMYGYNTGYGGGMTNTSYLSTLGDSSNNGMFGNTSGLLSYADQLLNYSTSYMSSGTGASSGYGSTSSGYGGMSGGYDLFSNVAQAGSSGSTLGGFFDAMDQQGWQTANYWTQVRQQLASQGMSSLEINKQIAIMKGTTGDSTDLTSLLNYANPGGTDFMSMLLGGGTSNATGGGNDLMSLLFSSLLGGGATNTGAATSGGNDLMSLLFNSLLN